MTGPDGATPSPPDAGRSASSEDYIRDLTLDLPRLSVAFAERLQLAGVPVTAERTERFARALRLTRPESRRRLYFTARSVFVTEQAQIKTFNFVFAEIFAGLTSVEDVPEDMERIPAPDDERPSERRGSREELDDQLVPTLSSSDEVLRHKRFDSLTPDELLQLRRLMARLTVVTPERRSRRSVKSRRGNRVDMRRTLHEAMRTGGDPIRLARRRRRVQPRRLVMLCDISGSMEPYSRAYLQFLACAAGGQAVASRTTGSGRHEAFAFATRLTRLTGSLSARNPDRAIERAASAAPDWSSGTRIGEALKTFNDRHGRRGMARGAVVVILSDGWERGDPALVGQEMERLSRLAHRIVWVNPRAAGAGFQPRAAGMAAALPYVDALISGESLAAMSEVVEAIGADEWRTRASEVWAQALPAATEDEEEPWASATPAPGSSVAMPSGWFPSRGHTTAGWEHRREQQSNDRKKP